MEINPEKIYEKVRSAQLNKQHAAKLLISLIEETELNEIREYSIEIIESLALRNKKIYNLLENILISEIDINVRAAAFFALNKLYCKKLIHPIFLLIIFDESPLLIVFIETLYRLDSEKCKQALIIRIQKIWRDKRFCLISLKPYMNRENILQLEYDTLFNIIQEYMFIKCIDSLYFRKVEIPNLNKND
ncbi:MAG: hypothetical protein ACTSR8_21875 [Promethearchaeota archaeon]